MRQATARTYSPSQTDDCFWYFADKRGTAIFCPLLVATADIGLTEQPQWALIPFFEIGAGAVSGLLMRDRGPTRLQVRTSA